MRHRTARRHALAALVSLFAAADARADRVRLLVLVCGAESRELAARVEGQMAELGVSVETVEVRLPATLDGQIALARSAAAARVVVWFGTDGGDRLAYVAHGDRVVARRIGPATGALSRSAQTESVALAVRTVLKGLTRTEAEPDRAGEERSAPAVRGWGELGWLAVADGTGRAGHQGATLRAGAARGRWLLGATVGYLPPARFETSAATVDVEREHAGVLLGAELLSSGPGARWSLALDLEVGAARFARATATTGAGLVARPAGAAWSAFAAPGLRGARRLGSGAWLAVEVGANALATPPRLAVQRSTGVDRIAPARPFEPRASISLLLDWR